MKALAQRRGLAVTFIGEARDRAGRVKLSHPRLAARRVRAKQRVCGDDDRLTRTGGRSSWRRARLRSELCLLFAPTRIRTARLLPGSWAPANVTWGVDNRTMSRTAVRRPGDRRIEFRLPGADANPYLAFAGILAAGIAGSRERPIAAAARRRGDASILGASTVLPRDIAEAMRAVRALDSTAAGVRIGRLRQPRRRSQAQRTATSRGARSPIATGLGTSRSPDGSAQRGSVARSSARRVEYRRRCDPRRGPRRVARLVARCRG